jgi:1,4-alpha-glucan branching enzyme
MMRTVTASNMLRRSSNAFVHEEIRIVHEDADHTVLGFMRWTAEEAFLCVIHLSESQWSSGDYRLQTGWGGRRQWKLELNSQAAQFGGWKSSCTEHATSDDSGALHISLPKWACVVYRTGL